MRRGCGRRLCLGQGRRHFLDSGSRPSGPSARARCRHSSVDLPRRDVHAGSVRALGGRRLVVPRDLELARRRLLAIAGVYLPAYETLAGQLFDTSVNVSFMQWPLWSGPGPTFMVVLADKYVL